MIFKLIDEKNDTPIIKVIGVGGGGSNAVNYMFKQGIVGVDFAICNTDKQAMEQSPVATKIQLGPTLTEGRGAGSKPNIGKLSAEESIEEVKAYLGNNCKMMFITAGMGGGTGTGAAPIIAKAAQEMDILTVGIVTLPFTFEGNKRVSQGHDGLDELKKYVDTIIVISNDKLKAIHGNLTISQAFSQADNILSTAAKGIAEIITVPGYVNVDFEDVNTVMRDSGVAIMGTAIADGENRAKRAVDEALNSPLLEDNNIKGAQHILVNITSGKKEVTMEEIFEITEFVQEEAGQGTNLIWGNCYDESLGEKLSVTIIATGFERHIKKPTLQGGKPASNATPVKVSLDDDIQPKKNILSTLGFDDNNDRSNTIEFPDVTERFGKYHEPYMREHRDQEAEERKHRLEAERRRKERLAALANKPKLSNPQTVNELENEPAYLRRGVNLDDVPGSEEFAYSKWTISENEDEPQFREGNSFLHDNVD
ncbi:MAG: cell division protein FtsZ [Lewinellaceae bacterium]|nr:cell division protein FtsZ [Saprospiraceae bacterium]MCB9341057.1 cell division protein FtsZ [Lewinellaceae bacterium]